MVNKELAKIFNEISLYMKMEDIPFKPQAYQKAAIVIRMLSEDIGEMYRIGGEKAIENIPWIGKSIAKKIIEHLKTGKIRYYEKYKKKMPVDIEELTAVEGIGSKTVKTLFEKLGIKNLKDLEKAAKTHKIKPLFGFDEITEKNILQGIEFLKKDRGRFLLGEILPKVKEIQNKFQNLKEVEQISVAGSVRRRKETIGDVDFLVSAKNSEKVMDYFVSLPGIVKVWGKGVTKSSVRMQDGFDVDLRVVPKKSFGSALQYFTGSKEHNIKVRVIAINKGLKLNEYGVFKGKKMIAGWSEDSVYKAIGLSFIKPELRENNGEVEAAIKKELPKLIGYNDICGDLHCHTIWDGGANSILEMAEEAQEKGYKYLGISDHTKFLKIENGLDEKQLAEQRKEIDKLNLKFKHQGLNFRILQGAETNILKNGSLDINDKALEKLDYVIAGIHSGLKMSKQEMTERIVKTMRNPFVKIISHPTGRILKKRDEFQVDFRKILKVAKETNTILEINSCPVRLDLNDINIKKAKETGVKMIINTDAHHRSHMRNMEFGIGQARRGWAEKKDIINTRPLKKLLELL